MKSSHATRSLLPVVAVLCMLAVAGCDEHGSTSMTGSPSTAASTLDAGDGPLSYYHDVKPILDGRCVACHHAGGVAPMALVTAQDAIKFAASIKSQVVSRTMPPWKAAEGCGEFANNRGLTSQQIATIARWVDLGSPEGDPADQGAPLEVIALDMARVDMRVSAVEPYTPSTTDTDDWRCFVMELPISTTQFITGIGVTPGNPRLVHHAVAYAMPPTASDPAGGADAFRALDRDDPGAGYACPVPPRGYWLTSWEPGGHGIDFPDGVGISVEPGTVVVLQIHYNTAYHAPTPDQTTVDLALAPAVQHPTRGALTVLDPSWLMGNMLIPANQPDVVHAYQMRPALFTAEKPVVAYWADLHMHTLGKSGTLSVVRADGTSECLLRVDDYDFDHQETYVFKKPIRLEPQDQLRVECHFDNTSEKQPVVNGVHQEPRDVNWGEHTSDEMCLGNFLIATE